MYWAKLMLRFKLRTHKVKFRFSRERRSYRKKNLISIQTSFIKEMQQKPKSKKNFHMKRDKAIFSASYCIEHAAYFISIYQTWTKKNQICQKKFADSKATVTYKLGKSHRERAKHFSSVLKKSTNKTSALQNLSNKQWSQKQ